MNKKKLAVLGFGDLGHRLFQRVADRYQCFALSRTEKLCTENSGAQWQWRKTDADDKNSLRQAIADIDFLVISMVPGERSDQAYYRAYVKPLELLLELAAEHDHFAKIVFVSSTSVMPHNQGQWVDETSPCAPTKYNGLRLKQAEDLLQQSQLDHLVVRFSGIYGRGSSRLTEKVRKGDWRTAEPSWTNRIHADDCAGVLEHLLDLDANRELFIGSDCGPALNVDVFEFIAGQLNLSSHSNHSSKDTLVKTEMQSDKKETDETKSEHSGKRCSNQKLLNSGFKFRYSSYREGYSVSS